MNRVLRRPMFRIGGSAGTGITSGLNTPKRGLVDEPGKYSQDDPQDRPIDTKMIEQAIRETEFASDPKVKKLLFPRARGISPGTLPGFLTSFGLNLASATPTGTGFGGLAATAAKAAQQPFKTFQAAKLARADDEAKFKQDVFLDSLQGQRDIAEKLAEGEAGSATEYAKTQAAKALDKLYQVDIDAIQAKIDALDPDTDIEQIEEYNDQIEDLKRKSKKDQMAIYKGAQTDEEYQREVILKLLQAGEDIEEILEYFPDAATIMGPGFKIPEEAKDGGRIGYRQGTKLMESVVEQEKEQGEVQDLSYTQLRSRLPNEISNEIVMLLANSKQALLDFANIQTTQDIQSFNQQYDVNLTLPQGA